MAVSESYGGQVGKKSSAVGRWLDKNDSRIRELRHSIKLFSRSPLAVLGFTIILIFILMALFAPWIAPYPDNWRDIKKINSPPSSAHMLGCEIFGGDILSMIIWGSRSALLMGFSVITFAVIAGMVVGSIAGYFGGWVDEILMRITDIFLAFPYLILAMVISAALGSHSVVSIVIDWALGYEPAILGHIVTINATIGLGSASSLILSVEPGIVSLINNISDMFGGSLMNVMIAVALTWWPTYARLIRGQVLSIKERKYVESAKAIGASNFRIITKHLLPNSFSPIIVQSTLDLGSVIITASALSFIGMGAQPGQADWGRMVNDGRNVLLSAPWVSTYPGLAILIVCLGFNLLGDGLRDILDPKMRR